MAVLDEGGHEIVLRDSTRQFSDGGVRDTPGLETLCWAVSGLRLWLIAVLPGACRPYCCGPR
ncbi:hypothetical protein ACWD5Q_08035 [Streptomyces sp. NPDC002513]